MEMDHTNPCRMTRAVGGLLTVEDFGPMLATGPTLFKLLPSLLLNSRGEANFDHLAINH